MVWVRKDKLTEGKSWNHEATNWKEQTKIKLINQFSVVGTQREYKPEIITLMCSQIQWI